uniref:ATP synthase subunit a n=1 Tax=Hemitheconyx taylori TaxID=449390 RepID=I7GUL5_9SAUR|nr:ATPase subunit 6 [Hemitheconyx taylori]
MTLSLFNQFKIPLLLGIPLLPLSFLPLILVLPTSSALKMSRLEGLLLWTMKLLSKHLFLPIKEQGHKWALPLSTLMLMLLLCNTLGLLPYTFTPTTQLATSLGLALPLWLVTIMTGLRNQTTKTLSHLLPEGTPTPLILPLILIESVSLLIRPIALGVRLTANLTAGHLLIQLTSTATLALTTMAPGLATLTTLTLVLLTLLEVAVAIIQAYVFVLLLTLYLQENI